MNSRFPCVTFSSDRVTFRIPSKINDGAPMRKQPTALTRRMFPQESPTTDLRPDSKCGSDWRQCECWVWLGGKCMEFVAAGSCTKKWLRFYQTIRNLTSGDLRIPLLVIRLGVTGLKKTRIVYLIDLLEGRISLTNHYQQSLSTIPLINSSTIYISTFSLTHYSTSLATITISSSSLTLIPKPSAIPI